MIYLQVINELNSIINVVIKLYISSKHREIKHMQLLVTTNGLRQLWKLLYVNRSACVENMI